MIKAISIIFLFYFFALFQTGFLAHFVLFGMSPGFFGAAPGLILLSVVTINIFTRSAGLGFFSAFVGGIYLDLFSLGQSFFGFQTLTALVLSFLIRFLIKKYVQVPSSKRF